MRKIIFTGIIILIFLLISSFLLEVDVAVYQKSGQEIISLNNQTHYFKLRSSEDFNSLAIRFLSYSKATNKNITFLLKQNSFDDNKLITKHVFNGISAHGQFYRFKLGKLKANKDYFLIVQGDRGVPYKIQYEQKKETDQRIKGELTHKLYSTRSIANITFDASKKASFDWFRLGYLYILSIFAYITLISIVLSSIIWSLVDEKND